MAISIKQSKPTIIIDGITYTLKQSDIDILSLCKEMKRRILKLHIADSQEILEFLEWSAKKIDRMLGDGATLSIFGDTPVDVVGVLKLTNGIAAERSKAHRDYIKQTYGV